MPQGHDITIHGENFDFYLYDPHASSQDDLLTPSDDSLFHVRSRISGQMLPFIGLSNFSQDAHYMEDVKDAIRLVIEHGGRDADMISLLPNKEIITDRQIVNFAHLLDDAVLKPPPYRRVPDGEQLLRESPIGRFINRNHYANSLFTPISRLHDVTGNATIPYADYQAVIDAASAIGASAPAESTVAIDARHLVYTWRDRVIEHEGNAGFLKTAGSTFLPHDSNRIKVGFFKQVRDFMDTALGQHANNNDILRLGDAANRIAHISQAEHVLQRVTRFLSVDAPDEDHPEARHPAIVAAAKMLANDNPYLSADDLLQSQLFDATHKHSSTPTDDRRTSLNTEGMRKLSQASSPEGMRNIFQLAERCEWNPMLFSSWGNATSTLLSHTTEMLFWRDVEANKPLRVLLRDTMSREEQLKKEDPDKRPLSKRSANLYLHNANAMDRINTAIRHYDGCESETLYTDSGERFVISFDALEGNTSPVQRSNGFVRSTLGFPKEARVTYLDANGDVIFDHQGPVNPEGYGNRRQSFNELFKHPLHFLQLPPGKLGSYKEFNAVVASQANNKTLSTMMTQGYLAHLDQRRDVQGRKVARKEYQSWIDVVKHYADTPDDTHQDDLHKYLNNDYLMDSDVIAEDISRSLFLNLAKDTGFEVGSTYSLHDLGREEGIDKDNAFTLDGRGIELDFSALSLVDRHKTLINYKKDMIEKADHLHHVGATLVKDHMPQADLEWEPATGTILLGIADDGTRFEARPLSSYHEIQRHGQNMSHCAGTYASQCMAGKYYLWAVIAIDPMGNEKEFSTLGMNYDDEGLEFDQHFGYNNASVPQPVSGMVDQLSNDLHQASQGYDADEWGYDDWDDDMDEEADYADDRDQESRYEVNFEATSYGGGDHLTPEEVAEVIANYHWQSEEFGQDAMRLLTRVYGEEAVMTSIGNNIDEILEFAEDNWPDDSVNKLKALRHQIDEKLAHRDDAPTLG